MGRLEYFENRVLVTGASGSLGFHLVRAFREIHSSKTSNTDVRDSAALTRLAAHWPSDIIIHSAFKGTVHTSIAASPELLDVAIDGLVHLLAAFAPKLVILPSSCAVYGETGDTPALPSAAPNPLSIYGLSKVICERILSQWAAETGNTAILLRIGNLVGMGGRGLAAYLVNHAMRFPEGQPWANMRGGGRMVRDYVPITYVVRVLQAVISENWEPGRAYYFNVGSGKPRSNGQVAAVVQRTLQERGIALNIRFDDQPGPGEVRRAVLDTTSLEARLGLQPPSAEDVDAAIRDAVLFQLENSKELSAQTASE